MIIKQLSVFLENRPGTLDESLGVLKKAGVNMKALSLADTSEFGILRIITDDPDEAKQAMKSAGYTSIVSDVLAVELKHEVGYLADIVSSLSDAGINIEYMYATPSESSAARMIIKTDDVQKAEEAVS